MVETKVTAATIAAALSAAVVWVLQAYVFGGEVPASVAALLSVLIPAVVTFAAGYMARHTPRHDLTTPNPVQRT